MRISMIENGVVVNVIEAESVAVAQKVFPDAALSDDSNLQIGWIDKGKGVFEAPPQPQDTPRDLTAIEFMDLFTPQEEGAIRVLARSTDPAQLEASVMMESFLARIMAADGISLSDPRVIYGANAIRQLGIFKTDARRDAVLAGNPPA